MSTQSNRDPRRVSNAVFESVLFAMFAAMMLVSKLIMEFLPNVHLLGMFTILLTVVFRVKALIPIYLYVFLQGLYAGFNMWWVPYLYIWTILWALAMLIPRGIPPKAAAIVYPMVCVLHGFAYGALYSPAQALMLGLDLEQTLAWIVTGIPWDIMHGIGNFVAGLLIAPLAALLKKLLKQRGMYKY